MNHRESQIRNLLWKEVAHKGQTASVAFSLFALIIFFYHFNLVEFKALIRWSCVCVILANFLRLKISQKISQDSVFQKKSANILRLSIWLNSVAWSLIFSFSVYELRSTGHHFAILITILTGFVASSIVTLAYDKLIFFPFQFLILFPLVGVTTFQYLEGINPFGHYLVLAYAIFFLYQVKQYKEYRHQIEERFNALLDLETSFNELKKSQASLVEQTAKLIHASKISALSNMAGGLAHEVNNSLMVIMGSTQQLQRDLKRNNLLGPSYEGRFEQSLSAITKIKNVIEGLKYFSLEMGDEPKEVVKLRDILQRTFSYTQELLKAHEVVLEIGEVPDVSVLSHPFQITQILFNIMNNADDAMVNVPLGQRRIKFDFELRDQFVLIRISNNGDRVPSENHSRLFQPFFSTKDVNQGTGLSLSTARGIALDHKGDLSFEDDGFTTFILKLPVS